MLLAAILSAWLQYGADGTPHARAVVSDAACPALLADGRSVRMRVRAGKAAGFDDIVCDAAIDTGVRHLRAGER